MREKQFLWGDKTFSFEKKLELRVSLRYSQLLLLLPTEGFSLLKLLNFVSAPFSSTRPTDFTFEIISLSLKAGIYYQRKATTDSTSEREKCLFHKSNAFYLEAEPLKSFRAIKSISKMKL